MSKCPFAEWKPITDAPITYTGGSFRIVHHTTEGSSAQGAFDAFRIHKSDPHFTVDSGKIYQHVDTDFSARSLRNAAGGVQTNRYRAIQIELVGFAGSRKKPAGMQNLARLCRWLEAEHDIPAVWPAGPPKPPSAGHDPGGHRRDAHVWETEAGHYGHSHVPENTHWDPAYNAVESAFVLKARFNEDGALANRDDPDVAALFNQPPVPFGAAAPAVMLDHADVGEIEDDAGV